MDAARVREQEAVTAATASAIEDDKTKTAPPELEPQVTDETDAGAALTAASNTGEWVLSS